MTPGLPKRNATEIECRVDASEAGRQALCGSAAARPRRAAVARGWYQYVHRTHALSESYFDGEEFKPENTIF